MSCVRQYAREASTKTIRPGRANRNRRAKVSHVAYGMPYKSFCVNGLRMVLQSNDFFTSSAAARLCYQSGQPWVKKRAMSRGEGYTTGRGGLATLTVGSAEQGGTDDLAGAMNSRRAKKGPLMRQIRLALPSS